MFAVIHRVALSLRGSHRAGDAGMRCARTAGSIARGGGGVNEQLEDLKKDVDTDDNAAVLQY
jgi:hypothetical protein